MFFAMYEEGGPGGTLSCLDDPDAENATIAGKTADEVKHRIGVLAIAGRLSHTGPVVLCQTVERFDAEWECEMSVKCANCGNENGDHSAVGDRCPSKADLETWADTKFKAVA